MLKKMSIFVLMLVMTAVMVSCGNSQQEASKKGNKLSDEQVLKIAEDAYFFGYAKENICETSSDATKPTCRLDKKQLAIYYCNR